VTKIKTKMSSAQAAASDRLLEHFLRSKDKVTLGISTRRIVRSVPRAALDVETRALLGRLLYAELDTVKAAYPDLACMKDVPPEIQKIRRALAQLGYA
jgi:hypothetical protein